MRKEKIGVPTRSPPATTGPAQKRLNISGSFKNMVIYFSYLLRKGKEKRLT